MVRSKEVLYSLCLALAITTGGLVSGCSEGATPVEAQERASHEHEAETLAGAEGHGHESEPELVEVNRNGSRFDPPVSASRIPEGAWMCNMNGVHFATLDPEEGACPICGMALTRKGGSAETDSPTGDQAEHHHEHGEH